MGSVNRCWKCGHAFARQIAAEPLPPIRRAPLAGFGRETDDPQVGPGQKAGQGDGSPPEVTDSNNGTLDSPAIVVAARVGSPFTRDPAYADTKPGRLERLKSTGAASPAALGGTAASGVCAVIAIVATFATNFPYAGMVVALIGLLMGIWGLYSKRRGAAVLGILLNCLMLLTSGFLSVADVYERINGHSPFEPPPVVEEDL